MSADLMRREILLAGPIVGLIYLYDDFFLYKRGVYRPLPTAKPIMDPVNRTPLTHAVKIVGWGTEPAGSLPDYSSGASSGATIQEEVHYWLIENSFGKSWGEGGYAKIYRDKDLQERLFEEQKRVDTGSASAGSGSGYNAYDPLMRRDIVVMENLAISAIPVPTSMSWEGM